MSPRTTEGDVVFAAALAPVCVARDERRSMPIPGGSRAARHACRAACAAAVPQETSR